MADGFTLKGKVVDEDEHALELVTVSCLSQGKVTMTNLKGEFSIDLQSTDSVEVRFSMVGYAPRKRVFRRPKGKLTVQIVMHPMEALKEVTVLNPNPSKISIGEDLFLGVNLSVATLYVPAGSKELYEKADVWKEFGNIIEEE